MGEKGRYRVECVGKGRMDLGGGQRVNIKIMQENSKNKKKIERKEKLKVDEEMYRAITKASPLLLSGSLGNKYILASKFSD